MSMGPDKSSNFAIYIMGKGQFFCCRLSMKIYDDYISYILYFRYVLIKNIKGRIIVIHKNLSYKIYYSNIKSFPLNNGPSPARGLKIKIQWPDNPLFFPDKLQYRSIIPGVIAHSKGGYPIGKQFISNLFS